MGLHRPSHPYGIRSLLLVSALGSIHRLGPYMSSVSLMNQGASHRTFGAYRLTGTKLSSFTNDEGALSQFINHHQHLQCMYLSTVFVVGLGY